MTFSRDFPIKNFHSGDFLATQPGRKGDMVHLEEQLVPVATKSLGKRLAEACHRLAVEWKWDVGDHCEDLHKPMTTHLPIPYFTWLVVWNTFYFP